MKVTWRKMRDWFYVAMARVEKLRHHIEKDMDSYYFIYMLSKS